MEPTHSHWQALSPRYTNQKQERNSNDIQVAMHGHVYHSVYFKYGIVVSRIKDDESFMVI